MNRAAGPMLARAADEAEGAYRLLVAAVLHLDDAGLDLPEHVRAVIEDVADLSAGLFQLADDYGHAEVLRRCG